MRLQILFFNETGGPIFIHLGGNTIQVASRTSTKFNYPGPDEGWILRVTSGSCDYTYHLPEQLEDYPATPNSDEPFKAEIADDYGIYSLPPSAAVGVPPQELEVIQRDGFPLRPTEKRCG
jgi:hypothetical protein